MNKAWLYINRYGSRIALLAAGTYVIIAGGLYVELPGNRSGIQFYPENYLTIAVLFGGILLYSFVAPRGKEPPVWSWLIPLLMVAVVTLI